MPATAIKLNRHYVESDELAARITELFAYITAATHQFLALVAEFDEKEYWKLCGVHSCAHWLNWQCGIGMNAAREKVRVARALQELPKIDKAFAHGEISYSKVRAITRAANSENEDYLLMFARHGTAHHVEKLIAGYNRVNRNRNVGDTDNGMTPHDNRELTTRWDEDGCLVVTARLPPESGALMLKAMELAIDRQFDDERASTDEPDPPELKPDMSGREKKPTVSMRRADALAELAETYLANKAPRGSTADRYQVVVHVSADEGQLSQIPKVAGTDETARRIACDCSLVPMFKNIKGEPLSVGRKTRSIPPAIMRALRARDGGCRFPGCTNSRFVDGHHIQHWADGGETSLKNLVLLCRHHHGLVHEGGFGCELSGNGSVVFKSPRGNVIPACFEMTAPESVDAPVAWISKEIESKHLDEKTCVTRWAGESCDWPLAVGHLFAGSLYGDRGS